MINLKTIYNKITSINSAKAVFFIWSLLMAVFLWALFGPVKIARVVEPIRVLSNPVRRGHPLVLRISYVKDKNYPVEVLPHIICEDGNLVTLAPRQTNLPEGEHTLTSSFISIPEKTSLGICHLELNNTYTINAFRKETLTWISEDFLVTL